MKNKNVSKWLKILGISVPALALVLFLLLGPDIIGGQGMLRKDIRSKIVTKEEVSTYQQDKRPQLTNSYDKEESIPPQITDPTYYYGGEVFSKANNQHQVIANNGKEQVFSAKIKDDLNSRVQYIKSIKFEVFGMGACQLASNCIQGAYININTEGETDYIYTLGTVNKLENVIKFDDIVYKLNDGKTANISLVVILKNSQPMPNEKSMFQILLPPQNFYITDETGTNVQLRSTTGTTVKGDEYYIKY